MKKIKKILAVMFTLAFFVGILPSCGGGNDMSDKPNSESGASESESVEDVNKTLPNYVAPDKAEYAFGEKETVTPFYTGNVIYNESVLLVMGEDGVAKGNLQFKPVKILSIRDYTLKKEYDVADFELTNNTLTAKSPEKTTYLTENNLAGIEMPEGFCLKSSISDILTDCVLMAGAIYSESPFYYGKQIYVSYVYDANDLDFDLYANYKTSGLPKTKAKLAFGDDLKICATGDSVMEGCSSSKKFNREPFMENFMTLTVDALNAEYDGNITLSNQAVGGKTSGWGAEDAQTIRLANEKPDLLYIHFGINDLGSQVSAASYYDNIKKIIDDVQAVNPECEVVLIKAFNANPDIYDQSGFERYWRKLDQLAEENENVYTLDMFTQSLSLIGAKGYYAVTGNGINHVNDFSARLYAMNMISQLVKFK